jgi:hypothetical protein
MASLDRFKLSSVQWDSDKEPGGFIDFMFVFASMVRALDYGNALEDWLDVKLDRSKHQHVTTPGFLSDDPEFVRPAVPADHRADDELSDDAVDSGGRGSQSYSRSSVAGSATLAATGTNYFDLPAGAQTLDAQLYNVLRMAVKGGKRVLLECVQFPSYVQAICVLFRHADISRNDRITHAFDGMDQLVFNGDVLKWQSDAVRKLRELFDSKASIMHYGLSRIMKSFNGKLKTIQYKIAQDLNSRVIDDNTNVFDMIQSYATDIASVGDSKHTGSALAVTEDSDECSYCHNPGHTEAQCRKKASG